MSHCLLFYKLQSQHSYGKVFKTGSSLKFGTAWDSRSMIFLIQADSQLLTLHIVQKNASCCGM
jgi:hypothetical protein